MHRLSSSFAPFGFVLGTLCLLTGGVALAQEAAGEVKIIHRGGYVAEFRLTYEEPKNGKLVRKLATWKGTLGQSKTFLLPPGARNVGILGEAYVFIGTKKTIFQKRYPTAPKVEITVSGTTLNRKFTLKNLGGNSSPAFTYNVSVHTGRMANAGTNANIFIRLIGTKGQSPEIRLNTLLPKDGLETGKDVNAVLKLPQDIGNVTKVSVRSDMTGPGADWYLHYLGVRGPVGGGDTFDFNHWFKDTRPQVRGPAPGGR